MPLSYKKVQEKIAFEILMDMLGEKNCATARSSACLLQLWAGRHPAQRLRDVLAQVAFATFVQGTDQAGRENIEAIRRIQRAWETKCALDISPADVSDLHGRSDYSTNLASVSQGSRRPPH